MKSANEDQLLKSLFKQSEAEVPAHLTEKVMQRIDKANATVFEYQPVINKRGWVIISGITAFTMLFVYFYSSGFVMEMPAILDNALSNLFELDGLFNFELKALSLPKIPPTLLVTLAAFNVIGIYLIVSYKWRKQLFR